MARAAAAAALPEGFGGFGRGAPGFFDRLAENNDRAWFAANRATYDSEVLAPLAALVSSLAFAFETHGIRFTGDPKRSVFRINRDVRFSRDKSPTRRTPAS